MPDFNMEEPDSSEKLIDFLHLEEVDQDAFEELYQKLAEYSSGDKEIPMVAPEHKMEARSWLISYMKLEDEVDFLTDYVKILDQRYLQPSRDKIEANEEIMILLKSGLLDFLQNAEEDSVNFPELAKVSKWNPEDKIIYPEAKEEKELAEKLFKLNSEFVVPKPAFDKKKIKEYYEKNKKVPIDELDVEKDRKSVRITRAKKKNKKEL